MATYDYDLPFQRRLLASSLKDLQFLARSLDCLKPEYFTDEILAGIADAAGTFFRREHKPADLPAILEEVKPLVAPGRKWQEYADEARKVWKLKLDAPEYYQRQAIDFARRQAMYAAVAEAGDRLREGEVDEIVPIIQRALRVGDGSQTIYYDYRASMEDRIKEYVGEQEGDRNSRVPSGFGPLDEATQGGLGPGEIGTVVGLPGHGKSVTLLNMGVSNVLSGRRVLHVTLENSIKVTSARYDARLLGKPSTKFSKLPNKLRNKLTELFQDSKARLDLVYAPNNSMTLAQLEGLIEGGGEPYDLVLVDYAALLRPPEKRDDPYYTLQDIHAGLRRVAGATRTRIWTAHQANRSGTQERLLRMEHLAGCFEIAAINDVVVSINWDETRPCEATMFVMKNRLGKSDFEIPCTCDFDTHLIRPLVEETEL